MNCKSLFFLVVFSLTLISGVFAQKKVSILGDSYSTFYGHVSPAANLCWYGVPGEKKENDVTKVEETWGKQRANFQELNITFRYRRS